MARTLNLRRAPVTITTLPDGREGYTLTISVLAATGMPTKIFLHEMSLTDPYLGPLEKFVTVANPFDISIYPEDAPDADQFPAYYRKDSLTIIFDNKADLQENAEDIEEATRSLINAYNKLETMYLYAQITLTGD